MILNHSFQGIGMTSQRTRERLLDRLREGGISNQMVLNAIMTVPRHIFIDEALAHRAYEDTALPIGCGQTISQPFIVAKMTEIALASHPTRILEVGTGCGYQTAVLSTLIKEVFTIERIEQLYQRARNSLKQLHINNVAMKYGDGYSGWLEYGPFDSIIITAAPPGIPLQLKKQLREDGGVMVLPVGDQNAQVLVKIVRQGDEYTQEVLERVSFVPMLKGVK